MKFEKSSSIGGAPIGLSGARTTSLSPVMPIFTQFGKSVVNLHLSGSSAL
ncbi:MAG: hypothetical protein RSA97_01275 [Oscillospiraceae bacterium]